MKRNLFSFLFLMFVFISLPLTVKAEHTHDESCYSSDVHYHIGDEINGGKCYQTPKAHEHNDNCYITECQFAPNMQYKNERTQLQDVVCPNQDCPSNTSHMSVTIYENKDTCLGCGAVATEVYCMLCGTTISGNSSIQHNTVTLDMAKSKPEFYLICNNSGTSGYELSCKLENGKNYGGLICNQKIVSITPEQPNQSGTLNTNVIVTYKDGHTETKQATSNYDSKQTYNGEIITLSYGGLSTMVSFFSSSNEVNVITEENKIEEEILQIDINEEKTEITIIDESEQTIDIRDGGIPYEEIKEEQKIEKEEPKETPTKENNLSSFDINDIDENEIEENNQETSVVFLVIFIIIMIIIIIITIIIMFIKNKEK